MAAVAAAGQSAGFGSFVVVESKVHTRTQHPSIPRGDRHVNNHDHFSWPAQAVPSAVKTSSQQLEKVLNLYISHLIDADATVLEQNRAVDFELFKVWTVVWLQ
ncbi:hypothetical protein VPH35_066178 [Triticum aestivum]